MQENEFCSIDLRPLARCIWEDIKKFWTDETEAEFQEWLKTHKETSAQ